MLHYLCFCRINASYIVKVADFGMCREVEENEYYKMNSMNKPLPVRWLSVEALKHGKFSHESDVVGFVLDTK